MEERKKPKKKVNWDKYIYFLVLLLIVFFVFRYFFFSLFYVDAPGHVLFKSLEIRVPEDITIHKIYKEEGDLVCPGDTLFNYISTKDELAYLSTTAMDIANAGSQWVEREIYVLQKSIALNQNVIYEKNQLVEWNKKQIQRIENEVILDITPKSKLENYQREVEKLTLEIEKLQNQNRIYQRLINNLSANFKQEGGLSLDESGSVIEQYLMKHYIAPTEGTVTRLYKNDHEVALKSENILNIHKREDIFIKAYFDQKDFEHVREGDKVTVVFPDGESTVGDIKRFYFATYKMPEEFQKKHESTTRTIAADIFPIEREDQIKWKAFYMMEVNVRISKFGGR